MELLCDVGHVEPRFGLFGDSFSVGASWCTVCTEHNTGSGIVLDEHDGIAR
jgi:hypothetical protein